MKLARLVMLPAIATAAMAAAPAQTLPIIHDDYSRARVEATERKLPIFVEVWAPW